MTEKETIRESVKQAYSSLAQNSDLSCCDSSRSEKLQRYGYSEAELRTLPESVIVMSDGCGNPTGLAKIRPRDVVLDLGSGGGIDVFLASKKVGPNGRVIGLDMTEEMVNRAQSNAVKHGFSNVEFKLGMIENIPLEHDSVDMIMSNCVICLSTDKERVFREMFRVLRPGGQLAIADEVALRPFSDTEKADPAKWCSCITGAETEEAYSGMLSNVGFRDVYVKQLRKGGPIEGVFSAFISGTKPTNTASL